MVGAVIHGWDLRGEYGKWGMGNGKWAWPAWCDICAVAMGCGPWAMGFNRYACGGHFL